MNGRHVTADAPKALRLDPRYGTCIKKSNMLMTISFILVETTLVTSSKLCNVMEKQQVIWYKATWYHLEGNISKYRVMVLGNTSETSLAIEIDNVTSRGKAQYLTVDEELNFAGHLSQFCAKTTRRINVIMRLRKLIPLQAKLQIYKSAVLPYFNYCPLVWHFCKAGDRDKLERINERGLRAVFCEWRASYGELLSRAHMTTLLFFFCPIYNEILMVPSDHSYLARLHLN